MFYVELFRAFQSEQLRYLLVGGLAVNLYGVERATMDVDIMLAMDRENMDRFLRAARALKLTPVMPVGLESLTDEAVLSRWAAEKGMIAFALRSADPAAPTLDILIKPHVPFEEAWGRRVEKAIGDLKVCLASVDDLIHLKSVTGSGIALTLKRSRRHVSWDCLMAKIDYSYEVSEERLRAYGQLSLLDRLRWLEDIVRFTALMRTATSVQFGGKTGDRSSLANQTRPV